MYQTKNYMHQINTLILICKVSVFHENFIHINWICCQVRETARMKESSRPIKLCIGDKFWVLTVLYSSTNKRCSINLLPLLIFKRHRGRAKGIYTVRKMEKIFCDSRKTVQHLTGRTIKKECVHSFYSLGWNLSLRRTVIELYTFETKANSNKMLPYRDICKWRQTFDWNHSITILCSPTNKWDILSMRH